MTIGSPWQPNHGRQDSTAVLRLGRVLLLVFLKLPTLSIAQTSNAPDLSAPAIQDTRDFLQLMGLSESELAFVADGLPLEDQTNETLFSLLRITQRLPQSKLPSWTVQDWTWEQVLRGPATFRGQLLSVRGRVTSLQRRTVPTLKSEKLGIDHYFVANVTRQDAPDQDVTVIASRIPAAFDRALADAMASGEPSLKLNERVRLSGVFYATTRAAPSLPTRPGIVLVVDTIGWFPDDAASPLINGEQQWIELANLGVDIGSLDGIRDRRGLISAECNAFYQLLAAVSRPTVQQLQKLARREDAVALLKDAEGHRGHFYTYRGTARRAIKVIVDDASIREALGITHYYELDVFDSQATVLVKRNQDDPSPVEFKTYPVVFCTRELPAGMATGEFIHENVEITGVYFKLWAYRTQFMDQAGRSNEASDNHRIPLQISPLLIGKTPVLLESQADKPQAGLIIGIGFIAILISLWLVVWWTGRGDRRFRQTTLARQIDPPESDSLSKWD